MEDEKHFHMEMLEDEVERLSNEGLEARVLLREMRTIMWGVMDRIDYGRGACRPTVPIGEVLSPEWLSVMRSILERIHEV